MVTGREVEGRENFFYSISYVIGYTDTPSYLDH